MKSISVVMATYNGSKFIGPQLQSLIDQTVPPLEVIVSDDGSTDDTISIANQTLANPPFAATVKRTESTSGYTTNFLSAAEQAQGEYVCFCDQDDFWLPNKIEKLSKLADQYPNVDLIIHSAEVVDADLNKLGQFHPGIPQAKVSPPNQSGLYSRPPGFAMCFKRDLLTTFDWRTRPAHPDLIDERKAGSGQATHDHWIYALANARSGIYYEPETLVLYRRHGANASASGRGETAGKVSQASRPTDPERLRNRLNAFREHEAYFKAAGLPDAARFYDKAARKIESRLRVIGKKGLLGVPSLIVAAAGGTYSEPGRLLARRALLQDLSAVMGSTQPSTCT